MRAHIILAFVILAFGLAGCSGWRTSGANPANWFSSTEAAPPEASGVNPLIPQQGAFSRSTSRPGPPPGVAIEQVTDLRVEGTNTGAIIYAEGVARRQGAYAARLAPLDPDTPVDADGVLAYRFEVRYPPGATPVGSEATRRVPVARNVSAQDLEGVRIIRVTGATNARESRRR